LATGAQEAKSDKINYILNLCILVPPGLFAIFYPKIGSLAATLGAIGGFLCIYCLPSVTFLY